MSYLGRAFAATFAMGDCTQHPSSVHHGGGPPFILGRSELPDIASTLLGTDTGEFLPRIFRNLSAQAGLVQLQRSLRSNG